MHDNLKHSSAALFRRLQNEICTSLEELDARAAFISDPWERKDAGGGHGGGGISRIMSQGRIFERAGVNFSEVAGTLPVEMSAKLVGATEPQPFFAAGISLVLHPLSPMVPTTHANFRYLEVGQKSWFGGGSDLTPYYLFPEDAVHFHTVLKQACDRSGTELYPAFKVQCDEYFYLKHRGETRGVGGIFFDYLGRDDTDQLELGFELVKTLGESFTESYLPIVKRRSELPYGEREKHFHLLRRGRYVEFNLLYDRGTQFGLQTGGRTESILMSLPPMVAWEYNYEPEPGSREAELLNVLREPRQWLAVD